MAALFPRWSNAAFALAVTTLGAGVVGLPLFLMIWVRTPYVTQMAKPVDQPIAFDHRHHVRDDGVDCRYCHFEADRSPYAGVPPTSVCMGCHAQVWSEAERLLPVRRSYFEGTPLRWVRVHQLPGFVYFDHSAHVSHGVGCRTCHGRVDLMAEVYATAPLTMDWCLDCHRDPDPSLRPQALITDMEWDPGEAERGAIGARVREELHVEAPLQCTACHR